MAQINSYLTFDGNCKEAMTFYQDCLGGELFFQTVGESPMAKDMSDEMKASILHSSLSNGNLILMASDMTPETGIAHGNTVSLFLNCCSEEEVRTSFEKLSRGGRNNFPLENTYWGALFGGITDQYGIHWMLNFDYNQLNKI